MKKDQVFKMAHDLLAQRRNDFEPPLKAKFGFCLVAKDDAAECFYESKWAIAMGLDPDQSIQSKKIRSLLGEQQWQQLWTSEDVLAQGLRLEYYLAEKPLFFRVRVLKIELDTRAYLLLSHEDKLDFPWPKNPQIAYNYCLKTDLEGRYIYYNDNYQAVFLDPNEASRIGEDAMRDILESSHAEAYQAVEECIAEPGNAVDVILEKQLTNGEVLSTVWQFVAWPNYDGSFHGVFARGYDVSALEKASHQLEEQLRELKLYHAFFENTYDALQVSDLEGNLIYLNAEASNRLGIPMAELQKYRVQQFDKAFLENPQAWAEHVKNLKDNQVQKVKAVNLNLSNGQEAIVEVVAKLVELKGEEYIVANSRDITEEERMRQEVKKKEEELALFFDNTLLGAFFMMLPEPLEWHDGVDKEEALDWVFENQMITRVNRAILDQYGYETENDMIGRRPKDFYQHDMAHGRQLWKDLFDRGHWRVKSNERKQDGSELIIEGDYILLKDEQGRILGNFGVQQDVTASEKARQALVESRERLKNLTARIPGVVFQLEQHGDQLDFSFLSPSYSELDLGLSREQMLAKPKGIVDRIYNADYSMVLGSILYAYRKSKPLNLEFRIRDAKGELRWLRADASLSKGEGNHATWYGVLSDLSDYKRVEEQQKQLAHATGNVTDGIFILDKDIRLQWQNEAALRFIHDQSKPKNSLFEDLIKVEEESLRDYQDLLEEMRFYRGAEKQIRLQSAAEGSLWVDIEHKPIWNDNGEYLYGLLIVRDINEMRSKQVEMQQLLDLTADQNKRLQSFTFIVSHNIRSYSANFAGLLDAYEYSDRDDEKQKLWQYLRDVSKGLDETIRNLNEVISVNTNLNQQKQSIKLLESINHITSMLQHELVSINAQLSIEVEEADKVLAVPSYLESIILNLVTNAIRYRDPSRELSLKISLQEEGGFSRIKVKDNGLGIDLKKHGKQLFELYQTFHNNPAARGLGLYILKSQVEAMGGKVEVKSKVDKGTSFSIYLPLS